MVDGLEIVRVTRASREGLLRFLADVAGETDFFSPHPYTPEVIDRIADSTGRDLYYVATNGEAVLGYGMLRGWDEGYEVPSLGISVHPSVRGTGLAQVLMAFLHAAARVRGASRVRLRVHRENQRARRLYESLGYHFAAEEGENLVGFFELGKGHQ